MEALASFVTKRGGWILVACLILTVIAVSRIVDFGTGEVKLRLDPSMNRLIPEADQEKHYEIDVSVTDDDGRVASDDAYISGPRSYYNGRSNLAYLTRPGSSPVVRK